MSLITDLLSKVKQQESKRDVPPLLKDSVQQDTAERKRKNKMTLLLAAVLIVIVSGLGALFLIDFLDKPAKPLPPRPPMAVPAAPVRESAVAVPLPQAAEKGGVRTAEKKESAKSENIAPPHKKAAPKRLAKKTAADSGDALREMRQQKASGAEAEPQGGMGEKISKRDKDVYLYTARTYEMQKDYQKAVSNYRMVLTVDPGNYIVMNNISSALIQLGSYDEAIRYAGEALQIRKDYIYSLINMGIAHSQLGRYKEGEDYLLRALSLEPSNRHVLLNIGLLHEKSNAFDKAREFYTRLADKGDAQGYIGLARLAEKEGKRREAVDLYRAVMSLEGRNSELWNVANDRVWRLTR